MSFCQKPMSFVQTEFVNIEIWLMRSVDHKTDVGGHFPLQSFILVSPDFQHDTRPGFTWHLAPVDDMDVPTGQHIWKHTEIFAMLFFREKKPLDVSVLGRVLSLCIFEAREAIRQDRKRSDMYLAASTWWAASCIKVLGFPQRVISIRLVYWW